MILTTVPVGKFIIRKPGYGKMLDLGYLLLALSYGSIAGVGFFTYYEWFQKRIECFVNKYMLGFGLLMLVPTVMSFFWGTGYLPPATDDLKFLTGFFAISVSALMLLLVYKWTDNRNLLYIFMIYAVTVLAAYFSSELFFTVLMLASFIVSLVAFLDLFIASSHHIKMGSLVGSLYALFSTVLLGLSSLGVNIPESVWSLPNFLLAGSLYMIYLDGKYCMLLHPKPLVNLHHKKVVLHLVFLRYVFYTVSITGLMLVSTVSIHELGHALTSKYYNCEHSRIVFDLESFPHTEIACSNESVSGIITLAGVLATCLIAGFLLLTGEEFSMKLGRLMFSYGFLIGYQDFIDLGLNANIAAIISLTTLLALVGSFYEISKYYIDTQKHLFAPAPGKLANNHQKAVTNVFIHAR